MMTLLRASLVLSALALLSLRQAPEPPIAAITMATPKAYVTEQLTGEERAIALKKAVAEWQKARALEVRSPGGACRRTHD